MESLEAELEHARALDIDDVADAVESIGFECTRCGACCTSEVDNPHTATVFPDEVRRLESGTRDWRDVARPMPYGLDGNEGQTFEWALQTDGCGDCTFYAEDEAGVGACTVHEDRPLICRTYPFSVALSGTSQPMGEVVDSVGLETQRAAGEAGAEEGVVRAHECEGLGRDISREDAERLARMLKERAIRELKEAIGVRENYRPVEGSTVVYDSEGPKRPDGREIGDTTNRGDTHE